MKIVIHFNDKEKASLTLTALKYEVGAGVVKVIEELEENSSLIASLNKTKEYLFTLSSLTHLEITED